MNEVTLKIKTVLDSKGLKDAVKEIDGVKSATQQAGSVAQKSNSLFSNFFGGLTRIAKLRMLRGIIRAFTQAVKEGTENIYQYSVALGAADASHFATTMNELASSFLYLKNSVGAVVAPLLSALLPALQTIISWVALALDYLAQFFAVINGQTTYTRAKKQATAWKEVGGAASGAAAAAKEYKNTVMSFDELHLLNDVPETGGGGGGGASAPDYSTMFEEAELGANIFTKLAKLFDDEGLSGKIKTHIRDTLDFAVTAIGPALSWLWGALTGDVQMMEQAWNELYKAITENKTVQKMMMSYIKYEAWVKTAIQNIKLWFLNAFEDIVNVLRPVLEFFGIDVDDLTEKIENQKKAIERHKSAIEANVLSWNLWLHGVDQDVAQVTAITTQFGKDVLKSMTTASDGAKEASDSINGVTSAVNNGTDGWDVYGQAIYDAQMMKFDGSNAIPGLDGVADSAGTARQNALELAYALSWLEQFSVKPLTLGINIVKQAIGFTGGGAGSLFANGGFVPSYAGGTFNTADVFLANENNNPELIGRIGNRTAVANQGQMVDAMAQGVYQAMTDVMSQGGNNNIEIAFNVDSQTLSRIVDKGNKSLNRRYSVSLA